MLPIRDHNPSIRTPYVTYTLIALNVLIFLSYWHKQGNVNEMNEFYVRWALVPRWFLEGYNVYTPLTAMFLHGGIMHLLGNMLFLFIFGDNMEDQLGHGKFLGFYLGGGLAASLGHILSDQNSVVPMIGASGAIAAVMGGYLLLFPRAKVDVFFFFIVFFRIIPLPAWIVLGIWFGLQLMNGLTPTTTGVAYWAHSGGFLAGVILMLPFWLRKGGPKYWENTHGHAPNPEARYQLSPSSIPRVRRRK
ncbi:rhomboid family intramembrane serine protease [Falsihalocynthiibacter sp. SS001]|uniref:rhomboid family intramembrane serine protease n=1 Tax=Falsihalocynthiibacter sp. SS001 TaxID=3349698 RepID=UPI0036D39D91